MINVSEVTSVTKRPTFAKNKAKRPWAATQVRSLLRYTRGHHSPSPWYRFFFPGRSVHIVYCSVFYNSYLLFVVFIFFSLEHEILSLLFLPTTVTQFNSIQYDLLGQSYAAALCWNKQIHTKNTVNHSKLKSKKNNPNSITTLKKIIRIIIKIIRG